MVNRRSRSSVKSWSTWTAPPAKAMTAMRSEEVIWVLTNFCAADSGRTLLRRLRAGNQRRQSERGSGPSHASKPQARRGLHASHRIGRIWQPELGVGYDGIPTRKDRMIEGVGRVEPYVEVQAIPHAERAAQRSVQRELRRAGDGIPSRVPPAARRGSRISRRVQEEAGRSGIQRRAGVV